MRKSLTVAELGKLSGQMYEDTFRAVSHFFKGYSYELIRRRVVVSLVRSSFEFF